MPIFRAGCHSSDYISRGNVSYTMTSDRYLPSGIPRIEYILGLLVALVVADGLITNFLVSNGYGWELNPLLQPVAGSGVLAFLKAGGALFCALVLWLVHRRKPVLAMNFTLFCMVFYTGIVYWGLSVFFIYRL